MEAGASWGSSNAGRNLSEHDIALSGGAAASMPFSQTPHLVESFFDRCGDFGGD